MRDDEVINALVVEDSPQIAERLVELVSVPNRVEVVATAASEDEALAACDRHTIALAIVDLQLAQGTGLRRDSPPARRHRRQPRVHRGAHQPRRAGAQGRGLRGRAPTTSSTSRKDFATIPRLIGELLTNKGN